MSVTRDQLWAVIVEDADMPGPISDSSSGTHSDAPYVPSWCYPNGPKMCPCGHHEGYHDDQGWCLLAELCHCPGLPPTCFTPLDDLDKLP